MQEDDCLPEPLARPAKRTKHNANSETIPEMPLRCNFLSTRDISLRPCPAAPATELSTYMHDSARRLELIGTGTIDALKSRRPLRVLSRGARKMVASKFHGAAAAAGRPGRAVVGRIDYVITCYFRKAIALRRIPNLLSVNLTCPLWCNGNITASHSRGVRPR